MLRAKYLVDDLKEAYAGGKPLPKILFILEYRQKVSQDSKEEYTYYLADKGLVALGKYWRGEYDSFADFQQEAAREQRQRIARQGWQIVPTSELKRRHEEKQKLILQAQQEHQQKMRNDLLYRLEYEIKQQEINVAAAARRLDEEQQKMRRLEKQLADEKAKRLEVEKRQEQIRLKQIEHEHRMKNDPVYAEVFNLLGEFNLRLICQETDKPRLMPILRQLKQRQNLSVEDEVWLKTTGKKYFDKEGALYRKFHAVYAENFMKQFRQTNSLWHIVNASSHFRKADAAKDAEKNLMDLEAKKINQAPVKLQAALLATHGGVKRDLGLRNEAMELAHQAHQKNPKDYRPCTLLGALCMEAGQYEQGSGWFDEAERLGAPAASTDIELRTIYRRANKEEKQKLKAYLKANGKHYPWLSN